MIHFLSLMVLAFAVSLDSFGVGLTYGLRKMTLPLRSLLFIAGCSALSIMIAMSVGTAIQPYVSSGATRSIGGFILIMIGAWALYQAFKPATTSEKTKEDQIILNFEIKLFGVVIRVLRKPMVADMDDSGTITGREAVLLGVALSLDAFGAGVGAAFIGYSPLFMAGSVALMSALFVTLGMNSGRRYADSPLLKKFSFIPGLLLVGLGLLNLF